MNAISTSSTTELAAIPEFDENIAEELIERAKEIQLSEALSFVKDTHISKLKQITPDIISQLSAHKITECTQIADMDVGEIQEMINIDDETAAALIIEARQPWFEKK